MTDRPTMPLRAKALFAAFVFCPVLYYFFEDSHAASFVWTLIGMFACAYVLGGLVVLGLEWLK